MTDTPDAPPPAMSYPDLLAALGFDAAVRAVVLTPTSAVAISADYPEPYVSPEATDGE